MRSPRPALTAVALTATLLAAGAAQAQTKGPAGGTIVCWKDKSGKVIGCGDKVPPEYQDSATAELNKRGVTVKQSDAALSPEQKKAQQAELERKQAEIQQKEEQRRKDKALLDTFSDVKEIDLKRGRDVQLIESNVETLQTNLKNATDRQAYARARMDEQAKNKQPPQQALQDEYDRAGADKVKIQNQIAQKRKDIVELNQKYDDMKKRFNELKGTPNSGQTGSGPPAAQATTPPPAATSAKK